MGVAHSHICISCMGEKGGGEVCPLCGYRESEADFSPQFLSPRSVLDGRYLVGRVLGHGGFGITYLAWDMNLEVQLALKEYLPREVANREAGGSTIKPFSGQAEENFLYGLDKFSEEARTLAKFHEHPGIVTVHNFFRANGTGYMVMQYVDGVTLKQYLESQGGKIGYDLAVKILMPVMDALRELHGVGLLHRDISPDNIYITESKRVKLLDFGAARYAAGEHSRSLSVILKPGYAPEEQYRSKGKQGPWTDVYALCATLYRAITGETPPEALDRMDEDELRAPSELGVTLPASTEAALMKGLAIRGAERWQTVQELQDALMGEVGETQPAAAMVRQAPSVAFVSHSEVAKKAEIPTQPSAPKTVSKVDTASRSIWTSGSTPPVNRPRPTTQEANSFAAAKNLVLSGHKKSVRSIAFSPNGDVLVSASEDHTVRLWSIDTGETLYELTHPDEVLAVAFSPDGSTFASAGRNSPINVYESVSGKVIQALWGHKELVSSLVYFPNDGSMLASGSYGKTIKIWDVTEGYEIKSLKEDGWVTGVCFSPDGSSLASSVYKSKLFKLWSGDSSKIFINKQPVSCLAFSTDGKIGIAGTSTVLIKGDTQSDQVLFTSKMKNINSLAFSSLGDCFAIGGDDVEVWSINSKQISQQFSNHKGLVTSVAFSPDGSLLAAACEDGKIHLHEIQRR